MMRRIAHVLSLIAALLGAAEAWAQLFGNGEVQAEGGVAVGGDVVQSTVTVVNGMPHEIVVALVRSLSSSDRETQAQALALLRAQLPEEAALNAEAVATMLGILGEKQVPPDQLIPTFEMVARRHVEMLVRLQALDPDDPEVARLVKQAETAISIGRYNEAEAFLVRAEETDLAALRRVQAIAEQAEAAVKRRASSAAASRVTLGSWLRRSSTTGRRRPGLRQQQRSHQT